MSTSALQRSILDAQLERQRYLEESERNRRNGVNGAVVAIVLVIVLAAILSGLTFIWWALVPVLVFAVYWNRGRKVPNN